MRYVAGYAAVGVIYVIQNVIRHRPTRLSLENMLVCGMFLLGWPVMVVLELRELWLSRRSRPTH